MQPSSQPTHSSSRPSRRRVHLDHAPHRPDHYEVTHRPRRVTRAHELDDLKARPGHEAEAPEEEVPVRKPRRSIASSPLARKLRRVRFGPWEWTGLAASCIACALLLRAVVTAQADHQMLRNAVAAKETQLAALDKQKVEDEKKLAYLKSDKGREQILAERGYMKPGDRILLFPTKEQGSGESVSSENTPENTQ